LPFVDQTAASTSGGLHLLIFLRIIVEIGDQFSTTECFQPIMNRQIAARFALFISLGLPMLGHAAVVECRGQNEEFSVFFDGSSCTVEPKESRQKWPIDDIYAKNCKITADTISVYWKHDRRPPGKRPT